jgi:cytochrome b561
MAKIYEMERPTYGAVARTLHWLTVLLIAMQFMIGWTMPDVHKDTQPVSLIAWHLGVGSTLVAVMVIRVIWRLTHWPTSDELSPLLSIVSRITHLLLYATLVLVPVLGWINASSRGWTVRLLGLVPYPALSEPGSAFGREMGDVHGIVAWVLLALIILHVVAALFHRYVLRDHVLQRMLPHAGPSPKKSTGRM